MRSPISRRLGQSGTFMEVALSTPALAAMRNNARTGENRIFIKILGYALKVTGRVGSEARGFLVGVGQGAHTRHHFRAGNAVSGDALPFPDPRLETVEFYKVSRLKVGLPEAEDEAPPPPWRGVPPPLAIYRERGHRRLAARTFQEKCWNCIWGWSLAASRIILRSATGWCTKMD